MLTLALLLAACAPKAPTPEPPAAEPPTAAVEAPAPTEDEPPPVIEEAPPAPNADFRARLTFADGRVREGRVVRVERGRDWYAEKGWVTDDVTLTLAGGGTEIEASWADLARIDLKYGARADVDCTTDSDYTPWMYGCVLKTTGTAKTVDGKAFEPASRHLWRFTFEDGAVEEFTVNKLAAREQDSEPREEENHALYATLQDRALELAKSAIVRIEILR